MKDLSEELLLMLSQRFRQGYGRELTHFEIKHQHLLDQIQAQINQKLLKGISGLGSGNNSGTSKSLRAVLTKDSASNTATRKNDGTAAEDMEKSFTST